MPSPQTSRFAKLTGSAVAACIALVSGFEGLTLKAEPDPIGIPTICYGEIDNVKLGDVHTVAECKALLSLRLGQYSSGIDKCIKVPVPDVSYVAFLSFTYNVGVGGFCGSTLLKRLNAGDLKAACEQLPRWVYAGGRQFPGLVTRRAEEEKICLEGVK